MLIGDIDIGNSMSILFRQRKRRTSTMNFLLISLFVSLGCFSPWVQTLQISCYSNASFPNTSTMDYYPNSTFDSCRCLMLSNSIVAFQYDYQQKSCYTMRNISTFADIRVTSSSVFCLLNQTTTTVTSTVTTTTLASAPISYSGSASGSNYYTTETVTFSNSNTLTSFAATIIVPKTMTAAYTTSYANFWSGAVALTHNETTNFIQYFFTLNQGNTIVAGSWSFSAQFSLQGVARPTTNDTFSIRIDPYQTITGRF